MEEYEHEDLDKKLQVFYAEVRTKDGLQYEPESLKSMLAALDRHLKEHHYKYSIVEEKVVVIHRGGCNNKGYYRLSLDVVTWDVDRDVSTAYC